MPEGTVNELLGACAAMVTLFIFMMKREHNIRRAECIIAHTLNKNRDKGLTQKEIEEKARRILQQGGRNLHIRHLPRGGKGLSRDELVRELRGDFSPSIILLAIRRLRKRDEIKLVQYKVTADEGTVHSIWKHLLVEKR